MRCSALRWPMMGSIAALRFISGLMAAVVRRTRPVIQTRILRVAVALIDVDALGLDAGQPDEIGDDGTERMAIKWIAVQRLGVQDELAALGLGDRRDDADLAAELVGRAGLALALALALADAFDLRRVERMDLLAALAAMLVADLDRQVP